MTQQYRAPEPSGNDWQTWARRLTQYLAQVRSTLVQQTGDESAADDATLMWDREGLYPVVSRNGQFAEVVVKVDVPPTNAGLAGDKAGLISWDTNYRYICSGTYDGTTAIWSRTSHLGGSW